MAFVLAAALAVLAVFAPEAQADTLADQARKEARTGGVEGSCYGCATPRMQHLVRRLIIRRFKPAGARAVRTALCVANGESGLNPGAISRTGDYGVFQINKLTWYGAYDWRKILDPVYNVNVGWAMSKHGTHWYPWVVWTRGNCH